MPLDSKLKTVNNEIEVISNLINEESSNSKLVNKKKNQKSKKEKEKENNVNPEDEMIGKSIEDDLIEFCQQVGIKDPKIDQTIKDRENLLIKKQADYENKSINSKEDYEEMNLEVFNQFISVSQILKETESLQTSNDLFITENSKIDQNNDELKDFSKVYVDNINSVNMHGIGNINKVAEELKKLLTYFSINDKLLIDSLFCSKLSFNRIYMFSETLGNVLRQLAENNFYIMIAGMKVFERARYRKTVDACRFRVSFQGGIHMENYLNKQKIDINEFYENHGNLFNQKVQEKLNNQLLTILVGQVFISKTDLKESLNLSLNKENTILLDKKLIESAVDFLFGYKENNKIENNSSVMSTSRITMGSAILKIEDFIFPIHIGENCIKLMISDNTLKVLKKHVLNYFNNDN